jgi:amino acid adenylation domain-containing protein
VPCSKPPLSPAQARLWFLDRLEGSGATYNVPVVLRMQGPLDVPALQRALDELSARHEILRTRYPEHDGRPRQDVLPPETPLTLHRLESTEAELDVVLEQLARHGFDLAAAPPVQATLITLAPNDHVLALIQHHIQSDGWSMRPLLDDLTLAYNAHAAGQSPNWRPLPVQYCDYTLWQREVLGDDQDPNSLISTQLHYWNTTLDALPDEIPLPTDRPRPTTTDHHGDTITFTIPTELHAQLNTLARQTGSTLYMTLQAGLAALLHKLGAGDDIPLGGAIAGRTDEALDDQLGFFVNTLVLRNDLSGNPSLRELLARTRGTALAAYAHQDTPFDRLVEHLNPARTPARHPLFQTMLTLHNNTATRAPALTGLTTRHRSTERHTAKFDLDLQLVETYGSGGDAQGVAGSLEFATALFDKATAESIAARYVRVLTTMAEQPDLPIADLDVLTSEERDRVLASGNGVGSCADAPVHELFEAQAASTPEATALVFEAARMTYAELDSAANRLAHHLITRGARRGATIAIIVPRDLGLVTALLATLKAGCAYMLLDPTHPTTRLRDLIQQAGSPVLVTTDTIADELALSGIEPVRLDARAEAESISRQPARRPETTVTGEDLACMMFTSGSTGKPKAVASPHRAITATHTGTSYLDHGSRHTYLQCSPVPWDAFALEVFSALLHGGVCVLQAGQIPDITEIENLAAAHRVTALQLSTSLFNLMVDEGSRVLDTVPHVMIGGETASPVHVARALSRYPKLRLTNGYGPVESLGYTTTHAITPEDCAHASIPIGRPIASKSAYVLDRHLHLVAPGVAGELYVAGDGLAHGYLTQPGLTAERFIPCPFAEPGRRMYRTGDLARWNADGTLAYLGRADEQVKIRGFRVEPREIEAVLAEFPGIAQLAVLAREDEPGDRILVGYVVPAAGAEQPRPAELRAALRAHAATRLPDYMVPSAFVVLDALPLTGNGKLDRKALPAPHREAAGGGEHAPLTPREEILRGLFADVLGIGSVGVRDDFFHLGGHSLLATRLISRIRAALGLEVPLRTFFQTPTVAGLATHLDDGRPARAPLRVQARPEHTPLSPAQARLWFLDRFEGSGATYNVPIILRMRGSLDVPALQQALDDLCARHETLRTRYPDHDGRPHQDVLAPADSPLALTRMHVGEEELDEVLGRLAREPFDLAAAPPIRATLITVAPDDHALALIQHHIVSDAWSLSPLLGDLALAYDARHAGHAPAWESLPAQYADYTLWQRDVLGDDQDPNSLISTQLHYWNTTLDALPDEIPLPTDRPRPTTADHHGDTITFTIPAELHTQLNTLARQTGSTLFMTLQTGLAAMLYKLGAGADIPLGAAIAGRTDEALEDLVGFFVNTLVLRNDLSGNPTLRELLARTRAVDLSAYTHQDTPFDRLVEHLNPNRAPARHPLFQTMLTLHDGTAAQAPAFTDLTTRGHSAMRHTAKFDLSFQHVESRYPATGPNGIEVSLEYSSALFDRGTVESIAARYVQALRTMTEQPDQALAELDVLTSEERHRILTAWNEAAAGQPAHSAVIHEHFEAQAARTPAATALLFQGTRTSYAELNTRANRLAHRLLRNGVRRGDVVGVYVPRGTDLVVCLLAVLKAGAAFTVLDPQFPVPRLNRVLTQADVTTVLAAGDAPEGLECPGMRILDPLRDHDEDDAGATDHNPGIRVGGTDTACVIFTSGSTGVPKGAVSTHRAVVGTVVGQDFARFGPDETWLQCAPVSWDAFVLELFGPLCSGGACVLQPGQRPDAAVIAELVERHAVSTVFLSASLLNFLIDEHPALFAHLRRVTTGGEAPSVPHLAKLRALAPGLTVVNGYGPVETMIFQTTRRVLAEDVRASRVPSGTPIAGKPVYVLDDHLRPVPAGVPGEVYMAGAGLAHGYVGLPGLSAERFIPCPFAEPGERMYRTGDLARWSPDGSLEHLGRTDDQIKIRGFRVEPAEIDAALHAIPGVQRAVTLAHEDGPGGKRLIAYVVAAPGTETSPGALRDLLADALPEHMVPAAVVLLDELPLTPNGKLDRKALPVPEFGASPAGRTPRTPAEETLCALFAAVLGVPEVSIDDSFFDLGGHSLLAIRLLSRIRTTLNAEIPLQALFETPTVAALSSHLEAGTATAKARPKLTRRT